MNENKTKIAAIAKILILVLLMLTGYFFWLIFSGPAKPKSEQVFIPPASGEPTHKSADKKLSAPTSPVLPLSIAPFFEDINQVAKNAEIKLKNEIAEPTFIAPGTPSTPSVPSTPSAPSNISILKSTPTEVVLSLTNDEFHFLYPDDFIASLIDAQNLFIKSYDPAYEPLLKIETDSQVRYVEEKIVATLLLANMITKEKAEQFVTTIHFTLPRLQLIDLEIRNYPTSNQSSINQYSLPSPRSSSKGLFLAGLVEKLYNACIFKAQASVCGYCYDMAECYQAGASSPGPGSNVLKAFCYCTGCYSSLGCLSSCNGRAAIYDPSTGICGCG